jgi:hypothetical protein
MSGVLALSWMRKLRILMLGTCTLGGLVLWVNYKLCYWPFTLSPFPDPPHKRKNFLQQGVAQGLALYRNYVPELNQDAAVLSAVVGKGSFVRMDITYQFLGTSYTDEYAGHADVNGMVRLLFSRGNRIDKAPRTFWTNTPYYILLYTTNGPVAPRILYDAPQGIWRFGSYYFSLKGPTISIRH